MGIILRQGTRSFRGIRFSWGVSVFVSAYGLTFRDIDFEGVIHVLTWHQNLRCRLSRVTMREEGL